MRDFSLWLHLVIMVFMASITQLKAVGQCADCLGAGRVFCTALDGVELCEEPGLTIVCDGASTMITNISDCYDDNDDALPEEVTEVDSFPLGYTLIILACSMFALACGMYLCCLHFAVDVCCAPRREKIGISSVRSLESSHSDTAPSARSPGRSIDYEVVELVQTVPRLAN